ncbi:MAG: hypothetical protein IT428_19780 [Planctomycetaceae bacterium]|nr:hypothetical protein [Planctomycetaceae bacterium]
MSLEVPSWTIDGLRVIEAGTAMEQIAGAGGDPSSIYGRANKFTCPTGKQAGRAWLLMRKEDLDEIRSDDSANPRALTLRITSGRLSVSFPNLYFVSAVRISGRELQQATDLYLVELADCRIFLAMSFINKTFNVRSTIGGEEDYFTASKNGGSPWTWQQMLDHVWGLLPSLAGAAPSLSGGLTPAENPERFIFRCMSAWDAYHDIAARLGAAVVYRPTTASFFLSDLGTASGGDSGGGLLLEDAEAIDSDRVLIPEKVKVCFPKTYSVPDEIRQTLSACEVREYLASTYDSSLTTCPGTFEVLMDDLEALYDFEETIQNNSEITARAVERGEAFYARRNNNRKKRRVYNGPAAIEPDGAVREVIWRSLGDGTKTEVVNWEKDEWRRERAVDLYQKNYHGCADDDWGAFEEVTVSIHDDSGDTGRNVTCTAIGLAGLAGTHGIVIPVVGMTFPYLFLPDECEPSCGSG